MGYELIEGDEMRERGFDDLLAYLRERLAGRKVYLCFDMDFFDPSVAPGVCCSSARTGPTRTAATSESSAGRWAGSGRPRSGPGSR